MRVDLRSDTVTLPTDGMRKAMMSAELGDDVLGDDPTVKKLEERCANLTGKAQGLFVPSGTMANLIAISVHTRPGDEVLLHEDAHPLHYETAGASAVAGVQLRTLPGPRGVISPETMVAAIRPEAEYAPRTTMLMVEDTSNRGGGKVQPLDNMDKLTLEAIENGLSTHLDGARLFHAVVASKTDAVRRTRGFDTVSFCFSKGLGCPVGSILVGDPVRIAEARRLRKRFGGAMRQAGILAGAALYALDHHIDRLAEDHALARELAMGLMIDGFSIESPETNIVQVDVKDAPAFVERLATHDVHCFPVSPTRIRLVVHMGISQEMVKHTLVSFRKSR